MQFMALGTQEELRDQIIDTALDRACLQDPLPDDDVSFHTRRDEGRSRLTLLAQEIARLVGQILRRIRGADEEAHAGQIVQRGACGHAEPAEGADRQALRDRYAVCAADAFSALSEGHCIAHRQAEGRLRHAMRGCSPICIRSLQNYQRAIAQRGGVRMRACRSSAGCWRNCACRCSRRSCARRCRFR